MTCRLSLGALALLPVTLVAACEGTLGGDGRPAPGGDASIAQVDGGGGTTDGGGGTTDGGPRADSGPTPTPDAGPTDPCAGVTCGANARCEAATRTCICSPGFIDMGGGSCAAIPPGDPAGRSETEVCEAWAAGHVENAADPWNDVPGDMCAPGTLTAEAIDDTLRRVNLFRWMVGLGPVTDDPAQHPNDQACALMMTRNGALDHSPPTEWTCYSAAGAQGAGSSNLALGVGSPGDAIDLYVDDSGVPSLGHRRWVLHGPLGRVGIGFAGNAQCLGVFDRSGSSDRSWTAWPSPGPFPRAAMPRQEWSFHSESFGLSSATVRVVRVGDGMELPVTVGHPPNGYGPNTVSWRPMGWSPEVGQRYRVTVEGFSGGPISYEVEPVSC